MLHLVPETPDEQPRNPATTALSLGLSQSLIAADDRAMILNRDNMPVRDANGGIAWVDVQEAVERGLVAMATPAPDVLAVDFDQPDNEHQVRRLKTLKEELALAGYVPVVSASGRPGHRHLWCVIEDPTDHARLTTLARTLEIGVRVGQRMRLPLAPHRHGLPVALLSPETPEAALRAVRRTGPTPALPIPAARPGLHVLPGARPTVRSTRPLGLKAAKALREGAQAAGYDKRHQADMGIALSAVQKGWSFAELLAAYADPSNRGSEKFRELGARGVGYLQDTWEKAQKKASDSPPPQDPAVAVERLSTWRMEALHRPWPTPQTAADLALYLAVIGAGLTAPKPTLTPAMSRDEMADAIGRWDVEEPLARLLTTKAISEVEKGDFARRSRWRVHPPTGESAVLTSQLGGTENEYPSLARPLPTAHDLFTGRALGLTGWQLLSVLPAGEPMTAAALAARTGRDVKTARGYVQRFVQLDLAVPFADGYVRHVQPDLDRAADALGVSGHVARLVARRIKKRDALRAGRNARDRAVAKVLDQRATQPAEPNQNPKGEVH